MMRFISVLGVVFALFIIASASLAMAQSVAIEGYDLVSYHTEGKPVKGSSEYAAEIEGASYHFASDANKKEFESNPQKYLPAYGGYCAYGVASGYKVQSDPEAWKIVNGRLYLNYSSGVQGRWVKDVAGNIAKADGNWTKIKDIP
ncbi:MAG: YHS domain-containing (seleno)protein [Deltaproteobacteria bacterium]